MLLQGRLRKSQGIFAYINLYRHRHVSAPASLALPFCLFFMQSDLAVSAAGIGRKNCCPQWNGLVQMGLEVTRELLLHMQTKFP